MKWAVVAIALTGCGPSGIVTSQGTLLVQDTPHVSLPALELVMQLTYDNIVEADDAARFWDRVDGLTMRVIDEPHFDHDGTSVVGTGSAESQRIKIAWNKCGEFNAWAGTVAHEMGHVLGHDHDYKPWFGPEGRSGMEWAVRDAYCHCPRGVCTDETPVEY